MLTMYHTKKDFEDSPCTTAILPVGALEQHGSHLPVGTDTIFADEMSRRLAIRLGNVYLLPALSITSSIEHRKGKGTVYIKGDTLALIIRDIAESLQYSGFTRLILLNFHGGNWNIKPAIRLLNRELETLDVYLVEYSVAANRLSEVLNHTQHDLHAGEMETSLMLHLHPQYVKEIKPQTDPEFMPQAFMDYFDVTEITEDGYWGFPEEGTAAKGEKMAELFVKCALDYIRQIEAAEAKIKGRQDRQK